MGTDVATGTSTGTPGSTGSSSATPAHQPVNSGFVSPAQTGGFGGGIGSMPQASHYMQGLPQSSYYMSDFGSVSNPQNFGGLRWNPSQPAGTSGERYGVTSNWTAPAVPTPGANPILLDRQRQRTERAAAEKAAADAAAAAAAAAANPWKQAGVSPTGYSGGPPMIAPVANTQELMNPARFNGSMGGIYDANGNKIY